MHCDHIFQDYFICVVIVALITQIEILVFNENNLNIYVHKLASFLLGKCWFLVKKIKFFFLNKIE